MIKDIKTKNDAVQPSDRVMAKLHADFPQCFTNEGKFDLEKFRSLLNDKVDVTEEGYDLNFLGKNYVNLIASTETETVIQPDMEHNSKPENKDSQNIYISGDNLDALKHLLKSYAGKIKCIYIDPPYNTGSDGFVYNDKFNFTAEQLQTKLGIGEGKAKRILDLCKRGSASHSAWLMFMAPRLMLARDLLTEDGVIFISIDDNEQANLKLLCDSVFGEENFVAKFDWRKKTGANDAKDVAVITESILLYSKNHQYSLDYDIWNKDENSRNKKRFRLEDSFVRSRGKYYLDTLDRGGLQYSDSLNFGIKAPDGGIIFPNGRDSFVNDGWIWKWSREKIEWGLDNQFLVFVESEKSKGSKYTIKYKVYEKVDNEGKVRQKLGRSFLNLIQEPINQQGNAEISDLFNGISMFSNPKPIGLIKYLINIYDSDNLTVLDFFSGSATTAHAVMKLNAEDEGNRKFIMVQLPEQTPADSEAHKAGYETINQIGQERIRRAAAKIRQEHPEYKGDLGFKHFTLQDVAQDTLDKMDTFDPQGMFGEKDILESFGAETVLATWMVKDGYGLTQNAEPLLLAGYTAYHCGGHIYMIDGEGFDEKAMIALVDKYGKEPDFNPHNVVLFGYSFSFTQTEMLKKNLSAVKKLNESINIDIRY